MAKIQFKFRRIGAFLLTFQTLYAIGTKKPTNPEKSGRPTEGGFHSTSTYFMTVRNRWSLLTNMTSFVNCSMNRALYLARRNTSQTRSTTTKALLYSSANRMIASISGYFGSPCDSFALSFIHGYIQFVPVRLVGNAVFQPAPPS